MRVSTIYIVLLILLSSKLLWAQTKTGKIYKIDRYNSIYLPLGKISFADSIAHFTLGDPQPIEKYRDSSQCLHEPNYKSYRSPDFLSLGCGGSVTVAFTDNGFMNLPGNDIYIFEVGPSREPASLEISEDGINYWLYAGRIDGGKSIIELSDEGISEETVFYYIRVTDLEDLCKSKSAGADIDAIAAINSVIKLTINADVLFDVGEYQLRESANKTLDSLIQIIQKVDAATLLVEGHTDSDGSDEYNLILSENRCHAVIEKLKLLFKEGAAYTFDMRAYGESRPRVTNDTDAHKEMNRRVEITVLPPSSYYENMSKKN